MTSFDLVAIGTGSGLEVSAEVTNALDRANALDRSLRQTPGGYEAVTRTAPGLRQSPSERGCASPPR